MRLRFAGFGAVPLVFRIGRGKRNLPIMAKSFCLWARVRSFGYAFAGIAAVLRTQHNAWIHALATLGVVIAGWVLQVSAADWCWLVVAMALVWSAECFNTALEFLADALSPEEDPLIGKAKDAAAGAVLIAAMGAAIIGGLVFWPYVCDACR